MQIQWDYFTRLGLSLGGVLLLTAVAYLLVNQMVPRRKNYRKAVLLVGLVLAGRTLWSQGCVVGGGRSQSMAHGLLTATANDYVRPGFWGGEVAWTELEVRTADGAPIYQKEIRHDDFNVDWRTSGTITFPGDYNVLFSYVSRASNTELKKLEVSVRLDSLLPSEVLERINRAGAAQQGAAADVQQPVSIEVW